jgi:hypothetical protein
VISSAGAGGQAGGPCAVPAQEPLVSVVMIFFNASKYLAEAIESVRRQTLPCWELVLVDDGSSDGSRNIADACASTDPARIRVFEHPGRQNLGTGPSRNLGMQMARGRYLAFLDADDVYEAHRLERPVALLEADPGLGVVINRELYWRSWAPARGRLAALARMPDEIIGPAAACEQAIPPPVLIASTLATPGAPMPAVCSITFRRRALEELGGIPDDFISQYEDQAIIVKLLLNQSAWVIDDCLARYRQHEESLTFRARETGEYRPGQPHAERHRFIRWVMAYAAELGVDEPLLTGALSAELAAGEHGLAAVRGAVKRAVRRAALLSANAVLPRRTVDRLIGWYLDRQRSRATDRAMRNAAAIHSRITPSVQG